VIGGRNDGAVATIDNVGEPVAVVLRKSKISVHQRTIGLGETDCQRQLEQCDQEPKAETTERQIVTSHGKFKWQLTAMRPLRSRSALAEGIASVLAFGRHALDTDPRSWEAAICFLCSSAGEPTNEMFRNDALTMQWARSSVAQRNSSCAKRPQSSNPDRFARKRSLSAKFPRSESISDMNRPQLIS
jgi:hypothetical protein